MSDDRDAGVMFRRGDRVFWIPEDQLARFEVDEAEAQHVEGALADEGEVTGFAKSFGNMRALSWGFEGSIGPKTTAATSEWLEYSPPPPPPSIKGVRR